MNLELTNFYVALPEVFILLMTTLTLLAGLYFSHRAKTVTYYFSLVALVAVIAFCGVGFGNPAKLTLFNFYLADDLGLLLKGTIALVMLFALVYSKHYLLESKICFNEFHVLALFCTLGMFVITSANSLLVIYLGLELMSLPLYVLIALKKDDYAIEAALKYFVMGAIASCIILYGMSLLYGAAGSLSIDVIAKGMNESLQNQFGIQFALIFMLLGVAFKLALAPLHMWAPDVYDGSPSPVTSILGSAPKLAAVAIFFRLLVPVFHHTELLQGALIFLAVASIAIGNLFALMQSNLKKLLAYSTVSHMGFIFLGVLAGTSEGYSAAIFYAITYCLTAVCTFGMLALFSQRGHEVRDISDLSGLNEHSPWLAFLMMILMFSMAGVPPTAGFIAKLLVLKSVIEINLIWLAIWGVAFAILGAYYYIRVVKQMYFSQQDDTKINTSSLNTVTLGVSSVNALLLLLLGIVPGFLLNHIQGLF
jgi:NADH-quinone oxidoreductase subunit N